MYTLLDLLGIKTHMHIIFELSVRGASTYHKLLLENQTANEKITIADDAIYISEKIV